MLSNVKELYFEALTHDGELRALFKDEAGNTYFVSCENVLSYKVTDEELLTPYWDLTLDKQMGWTRFIEGGEFLERAKFFESNPALKHYLIATYDYCLEIICYKSPKIGKL